VSKYIAMSGGKRSAYNDFNDLIKIFFLIYYVLEMVHINYLYMVHYFFLCQHILLYGYHNVLIHHIFGHLDCFQALVVINNIVIHTITYTFAHM
jgi:hypothetical protein